jgi:putative transposase
VLFFVEYGARRAVGRCHPHPTAAWVAQQASNLLMDLRERAEQVKFVNRDRDTKFPTAFDRLGGLIHTSRLHKVTKTPRCRRG